MAKIQEVTKVLETQLGPLGMEVSPFRVGWYNDALEDESYALTDLPEDTVAFVVVSGPSMFDKAFVPFVKEGRVESGGKGCLDPIDQCMAYHFNRVRGHFPVKYGVEPIHDFEMTEDNKPKLLAQLAVHVAASARCYKQQDLTKEGLDIYKQLCGGETGKIYPICLHPKFGGWFGVRGILLFTNMEVEKIDKELPPKDTLQVLSSQEDIARLLYLYNNHWEDWRFRDVGMPDDVERYSELQKEYFGTLPRKRQPIINKIMSL